MKLAFKRPVTSIVLSTALLALVVVAGWLLDAPLFVRIHGIAGPAFAANPNNPSINVDDLNDLNGYPPNRLAKFLCYPSAQARTVVCIALANRRRTGDPESWTGVLPSLLASFRATEGRERRHVLNALLCLPHVLPSEAELVFGFVDEQLAVKDRSWMLCAQLLETTARSCPDLQSRVLQAFARSMEVGEQMVRDETLRRLASIDPNCSEAAEAARIYTRAIKPTSPDGAGSLPPSLFGILRRQPALLDEFLSGKPSERLIAIAAANSAAGGSRDLHVDGPRAERVSPERRHRLLEAAKIIVADAPAGRDGIDDWAAIHFLRNTPGNEDLLFDAARKAAPGRRRHLLGPAIANAKLQGRDHAERFLEARSSDLLAWLQSENVHLRRSVAGVLLPSSTDPDWLKRLRNGPDAPIVEACRRLMDERIEEHELSCLRVLEGYGQELDPRDVDRVAVYFERKFDKTAKQYKRDAPFYSGAG